MGKGQSPTQNELKFIHELLAKGYSDTDILAKYEELKKHGKLGSLPYRQDVRFVRQRRKEFESSRTILEDTIKRLEDPSVAKAREEHHAEIRAIVEKWLKVFPCEIPLFAEQFEKDKRLWFFGLNNLPLEVNNVCNDPFFKVVREHLQSEDLWKKYSDWETMWAELVETCEKVRGEIGELRKLAEAWPNILELRKDFERPIINEITQRQFGTDYLSQLHFVSSGEWLYAYFEDPDGEKDKTSQVVLRAEHPEEHIRSYKSLITDLLNTKETIRIVMLSSELFDIEESIREAMRNILIRHAWVTSTCKWCPGQSPLSQP